MGAHNWCHLLALQKFGKEHRPVLPQWRDVLSFLPGYPSKCLEPFLSPSLGLLSSPLLQEQPAQEAEALFKKVCLISLTPPRCLPSPQPYLQSSHQQNLDHQRHQGDETSTMSSPKAYRSVHPSPTACQLILKVEATATLQYALQVTNHLLC